MTYMITRRCTQRQFLLKPTPVTTRIIAYCLACAANRAAVQVHAVCALSNHLHAVVSDPEGRLPEFLSYFHRCIAKAVNCSLGRWENLWAPEQTSVVRLVDAEDVVHKLVYVLCNPVSARLVASSAKWPGLWGFRRSDGGVVARPGVFFRKDGPMPVKASLRFVIPPALGHLAPGDYEKLVEQAIAAEEERIRQRVRAEHARFFGARRVMQHKVTDTPLSVEPRRRLRPRVAAHNKWRRVEALGRLESFLEAYRNALVRWRAGVRRVLFPPGTYALRLHYGVMVATC